MNNLGVYRRYVVSFGLTGLRAESTRKKLALNIDSWDFDNIIGATNE